MYKNVMLKISGESLAGSNEHGFDFDILNDLSNSIKKLQSKNLKTSPFYIILPGIFCVLIIKEWTGSSTLEIHFFLGHTRGQCRKQLESSSFLVFFFSNRLFILPSWWPKTDPWLQHFWFMKYDKFWTKYSRCN